MATLKVTAQNFILQSTWKCERKGKDWVANGQLLWKLPSGQPSRATTRVAFPYSLPSGAAITSAKIWATVGGMYTGYSILTVNGNGLKYRNGQEYGADVLITELSGSIIAEFAFKANGNAKDGNSHISTASFSNVYLAIEYEGAVGKASPTKEYDNSKFAVPPQSVCIYHQTTGKLYMFDGVVKLQHGFTTKIEEEPKGGSEENNKNKWVNNAKNEPDKLTLEVAMSDVYTDDANMTMSTGWDESMQQQAYNASKNAVISDFTRSGNAVRVLRRLKESREKLSVITPQYVHVDMLISSIAINQDETCPFGWMGTIEFQHAYKPKVEKVQKKDTSQDTGTPPTRSVLDTLFSGGSVTTGVGQYISNLFTVGAGK